MEKYTTAQLKAALIELRKRDDKDAVLAYRMAFDALADRLGDEEFDKWMDEVGF